MDAYFRRALVDEAMRSDLLACRTTDEFIDLARAQAAAQGLVRTRAEVEAALMAASRAGTGLRLEGAPEGDGWLPGEVSWRDGNATVHWCWLGRRRLSEPFFLDSLQVAQREPFNRFMRPVTSIEALERRTALRPGLPLVGLIAHVSRCGSTLVSQMLASLPSLVVASEPPPFDAMLREGPVETGRAVRLRWMRAMASALGQPRDGGENGFIMKLDSWHLAHLPLVREAFPGVPLVVLYREPAAVLASQMLEPGLHMAGVLEGPPFDGIPFPGPSQLDYRARILGRIFEAAVEAPEDAAFVSYDELPGAVATRLAPLFGLRLDSEALERMRRVETRNAKSPGLSFAPGAGTPPMGLSAPDLAAMAERFAGRGYRALERRRERR